MAPGHGHRGVDTWEPHGVAMDMDIEAMSWCLMGVLGVGSALKSTGQSGTIPMAIIQYTVQGARRVISFALLATLSIK